MSCNPTQIIKPDADHQALNKKMGVVEDDLEVAEGKQMASGGEEDSTFASHEQEASKPSSNTGSRFTAPRIAAYVCLSLICIFILLLVVMAIMIHAVVENNQDEYMQIPDELIEEAEKDIARYEPYQVGESSSEIINLGLCTGNATFNLGTLTGLSTVDITKIELIKGTGKLDMAPLGFKGNTWSGTFLMHAAFDSLQMDVGFRLVADDCFIPLDQTFSGSTTLENSTLELLVDMDGETKNIFTMLAQESQVNTANIQDLNFTYESMKVDMSMFGGLLQLPPIDFVSFFGGIFDQQIREVIEPLMQESMQEAINDELPISS